VRQFEVYANPSASSRDFAPYIVVLQSHYLPLDSVIVAPLVSDKLASSIDLGIAFDGASLVLAITEMGAANRSAHWRIRKTTPDARWSASLPASKRAG
jgi:hypothetical protein